MLEQIIPLTIVIFSNSWKAMLLIGAIFVLRFILGRKLSPGWRFSLWLVVTVPLVVQISFPFSWSIFQIIPSGSQLLDLSVSTNVSQGICDKDLFAMDSGLTQNSRLLPWWLLSFSCLWFAGCLMMVVVFARQIFACRQWIRQSRPVTCQRTLEIFEDCRRRMNVKTWLHVAECPEITGPFLIGAIRPVLLLPEGMLQTASKNQLQTVFLHELAHLKRWDVWTSWLMSILLAVHWFNPFLWLAIRRMNTDREEACDAMALKILNPQERQEYGLALLDIAEHFLTSRKAPGLVGISETLEQMSARIAVIKQVGTWKWKWKLLTGGLFCLISLSILTDPPVEVNDVSYGCPPYREIPCCPSWCMPYPTDDCRSCCEDPCKPMSCEDFCLPCEDYCECD